MNKRTLPPGWPRQVAPPVGEGWVRDASAWLLDQCPADYRGVDVLRRHPLVLLAFTRWHVRAQRTGATTSIAGCRTALRGQHPQVVAAALSALEAEQVRLDLVDRGVEAVGDALEVFLGRPAA